MTPAARLAVHVNHLREALSRGDQDAAQCAADFIVKIKRRMRRDGR